MRCLFLSILLTVMVFTGYAQTAYSDYADFSPEEIALKQCAFDKDADAIIFFDKAKAYYNDDYNLITERRVRFKVLKDKAVDRGNVRIRFYGDGFESISDINATVLSFDAAGQQVISKLDRKLVYTRKLNKYYSELTFALPNIKAGSLVEYKYKSNMKHYGGLRDWTFQSDIPVMHSSYDLTILPNTEFAYTVYKLNSIPIEVKPNTGTGSILFEMHNLPGLRDEAYIGAVKDYLQRVKFQFAAMKNVATDGWTTTVSTKTNYTNTWNDLARELMDNGDFGSQINKSISESDVLVKQWLAEPDLYKRMKAVHNYVRNNFSWNDIYTKYAETGVKDAWAKKTGTAGDLNLLLIKLLKSAELDVKPMLVSERDFGKIDTSYPYISQFEKVVASVTLDNKRYVLDATDKETPTDIIPFMLLNTTAFIVDKKEPSLVRITEDQRKNLKMINTTAEISNTGSLKLHSSLSMHDYAKVEAKHSLLRDKDGFKKELFGDAQPASIDSFKVTGQNEDNEPLSADIDARFTLNKAGGYYLLKYNQFIGLDKNPFVNEHRFSDIDFGNCISRIVTASFTLPSDLVPETLPKNTKLVMPGEAITAVRQMERTGNTIKVSIGINFKETHFDAEDYPDLQMFFKSLIDLLNDPILLKAKA